MALLYLNYHSTRDDVPLQLPVWSIVLSNCSKITAFLFQKFPVLQELLQLQLEFDYQALFRNSVGCIWRIT